MTPENMEKLKVDRKQWQASTLNGNKIIDQQNQHIDDLEKDKEDAVDVCRALIAHNEDGDRVVPIETVKLMAAEVVEKEDDGKH